MKQDTIRKVVRESIVDLAYAHEVISREQYVETCKRNGIAPLLR
jgi:hypothetical protein